MTCLPPTEESFVRDRKYLLKELKDTLEVKRRSGFISAIQLLRVSQVIALLKSLEQKHQDLARKYGFVSMSILDIRKYQ